MRTRHVRTKQAHLAAQYKQNPNLKKNQYNKMQKPTIKKELAMKILFERRVNPRDLNWYCFKVNSKTKKILKNYNCSKNLENFNIYTKTFTYISYTWIRNTNCFHFGNWLKQKLNKMNFWIVCYSSFAFILFSLYRKPKNLLLLAHLLQRGLAKFGFGEICQTQISL